jgi:hypothetical protein
MRGAAVFLLVVSLAAAGCSQPSRNTPGRSPTGSTKVALTPSTQTAPTLSIRGGASRPASWEAVRYRGLGFVVPATWRVREGRRFPCPGTLSGPAVVLGHSDFIPPCPMPRLRTPLLWIDDRVDDQLPTAAVATSINGQNVWLLRLGPGNLGQASDDDLMYWSQYRRARGFQLWDLRHRVRAELLDPTGGVVADQVLSTLHWS